MNIQKCLDKYSDEYYRMMFALPTDKDDSVSYLKAKDFLERYALNNIMETEECLAKMCSVFKVVDYQWFDIEKMSLDELFKDEFHVFISLSSPLFQEENFLMIQNIEIKHGGNYLYVIEEETCEEDKDVAIKLRIPIDISWQEMKNGGFISDILLNMPHNNYFVFGDSGNWGRWYDYENPWRDYEVFGYKKETKEILEYRKVYSLATEEWDVLIKNGGIPHSLRRWRSKESAGTLHSKATIGRALNDHF